MYRLIVITLLISSICLTACNTPTQTPPVEPVQHAEPTVQPTLGATPEDVPTTYSLHDLPVIPEIPDNAVATYNQAVDAGRDPHIFTTVGDCMTANDHYLRPISEGDYHLGEYEELQEVIIYFSSTVREVDGASMDSFNNPSMSAVCGFNTAATLDPIWVDPDLCASDESSLQCELRISNASIALIMLGTHDVYIEAETFRGYLDEVIQTTLDMNVLPILYTFPTRTDYVEKSEAYSQVIVEVAQEYHLPIVNLWLALQDLENYGVQPDDTTKLSLPADSCTTCFTEENLLAGETVHNLITLQALSALLEATTN